MRRLFIIVLFSLMFSGSLHCESGASEVSRDWIYYRQEELYAYLLLDRDLPENERSFLRQKAYAFFFSYWVLHRSQYAMLRPVERFEQDFAHLLKARACPYVDEDDPVGIRSYYKDGVFVPKALPRVEGLKIVAPDSARLPHVQGLPPETLKTWAGYQRLVSEFRKFLDSSLKGAKPKH